MPAGARALDVQIFPIKHPYRICYSPGLAKALDTRAAEFDVIHIHSLNLHTQYAAWRAARAARRPYVISPHGALDPYIRRRGRLRKTLINVAWQNRMIREANAIHFTSDDERDLASDVDTPAPKFVIPNGLHLDRFRDLPDRNRFRKTVLSDFAGPVVLNHGRITDKKGLDILVSALAIVERYVGSVRLVLVGPDDEGVGDRLREQIADLGLRECVTFVGPLADEDLVEALATADVWCLPSHSENFGYAVVEAMAAGLPVVTSPHVNIAPGAAALGALIMVQNEPERVASSLIDLLTHPEKRSELSQRGREFAGRYDWSRIRWEFLDMYSKISADGPK
jgi:glycosyltransferase involved in cell wall biosynthesis